MTSVMHTTAPQEVGKGVGVKTGHIGVSSGAVQPVQTFQTSSFTDSTEVAGPTILVVLIPKNHLFRVFFFFDYSGTAHELMVLAKPPNTHPRPHLMQREQTDLLNLPTCCTISGVQNFNLKCKIDTVIQLF